MIRYPELEEALDGLDLVELSVRSGVALAELSDALAGGYSMPQGSRARLAAALGIAEPRLFATSSTIEGLTFDVEAAFPSERFVRDPAALRAFDGPRPAA